MRFGVGRHSSYTNPDLSEIAVFVHEMAELDRKAIEEFVAGLGPEAIERASGRSGA